MTAYRTHPVDDLGAEVPLRGHPRRVVSLVPSLTEAIAETVPGVLAGATTYCTHPAGLDVPRVGGSKYPVVDSVAELAPDLVVANSEENRPGDVAALREAGIPVWVTRAPATVPHALDSLERLVAGAFDAPVPDWLAE
ncbi:helical backbone metal receptor, partial [Saccharomonospora saliphila]|uniref:helical backbone metal receptor n=1 Tax=Saccharomonospora saliphila TaxID=369829 RepID=UPI00048EB1DA